MTVPKRFGVLRFFGTLLKVIAWIVLVLSVLGAIGVVVAGSAFGLTGWLPPSMGESFASLGTSSGIIVGLMMLILGLLYFLVLYVAGETLHLQVAVEENTRLTAALLLRMHQEGQGETAATYGAGNGGFVNEPFEN